MPRKIAVLLSILVLTAGASFGADPSQPVAADTAAAAEVPAETAQPQTGDVNHTVVKGDTLWDLSGRYYGDPWVWIKVWQVNKNIVSDPNLIYTDQVLVIPDKSRLKDIVFDLVPMAGEDVAPVETAAEKAPEEPADEAELPGFAIVQKQVEVPVEEVVEEEVTAEPPLIAAATDKESAALKKYRGSASMVVPRDWKVDGKIVGEKDKKLMISAGDTVYVNLGKDRVQSGTMCMIYRKVGKIKDPKKSGGLLGYEVRRVGKLEITDETGRDASSARILVSYEPIKTGDGVIIITTGN